MKTKTFRFTRLLPMLAAWLMVSVISCTRDKDNAPPPQPTADFDIPAGIKAAVEVTFTNKSSHATTFVWKVNNTTVPASAVTAEGHLKYTFAASGNYEIALTASNSSQQNTITKTVTVGNPPAPVADFVWEQVNPGFILPQYKFTDKSLYASEWQWSLDTYGNRSAQQNPTLTLYNINKVTNIGLNAINATGVNQKIQGISVGDNTHHIASYTFPASDVLADFSGHNKTGQSVTPPSSATGVNGKLTSGRFVPGTTVSQYMRIPDGALLTPFNTSKKISVSLWVKVANATAPGVILGLINPGYSTYIPAIFCADNKLYGRWAGSLTTDHIATTGNITSGTWYHIVLNGDAIAKKQEMFFNGQSQGSIADDVIFLDMSLTYLGWSKTAGWNIIGADGLAKYFDGNLAAVRFFDRTLTQEEVNALYHEFD